jgi:hypothetical protein
MAREAWAMELDNFDNIWLAGRWGVFRQKNDTLIKFSDLREAYDVVFTRVILQGTSLRNNALRYLQWHNQT